MTEDQEEKPEPEIVDEDEPADNSMGGFIKRALGAAKSTGYSLGGMSLQIEAERAFVDALIRFLADETDSDLVVIGLDVDLLDKSEEDEDG